MVSKTEEIAQAVSQASIEESQEQETEQIRYSVGVMAYNEEANIKRSLQALLEQRSERTGLDEIIVVASGCTDHTVDVVQEMMEVDSRIHLLVQLRREGKASAINLFLQHAHSPVLVMTGADIIPERDALERLCAHFSDRSVGMVGAHPVPVNDQHTFIGHAVHLLWNLHDRLARRDPKLGEVVAFRNIISAIPTDTAVDEISIQSQIARHRLRLAYEGQAIVYNKGPMTLRDFLKQRRRIYAGHLQVRREQHYTASTMSVRPILQELLASAATTMGTPREALWTCGTIALEGIARLQGYYDVMRKRPHHIWQAVSSTKKLEDEQRKLRRICNTQSVIVFQVSREGSDDSTLSRKQEERITLRLLRKMLPLLRHYLRRDDLLSINGSNTLVALLNANRAGAESIALRLKRIIESQPASLARNQSIRLKVTFHAVSFGE
jgi:poly-beta-1,6-N-acetyl-D-glucosamine synthase